jgi:hypothetical protein
MRAAFARQPDILLIQTIQDDIAWAISLQVTSLT